VVSSRPTVAPARWSLRWIANSIMREVGRDPREGGTPLPKASAVIAPTAPIEASRPARVGGHERSGPLESNARGGTAARIGRVSWRDPADRGGFLSDQADALGITAHEGDLGSLPHELDRAARPIPRVAPVSTTTVKSRPYLAAVRPKHRAGT
jgi:hypothetical protein